MSGDRRLAPNDETPITALSTVDGGKATEPVDRGASDALGPGSPGPAGVEDPWADGSPYGAGYDGDDDGVRDDYDGDEDYDGDDVDGPDGEPDDGSGDGATGSDLVRSALADAQGISRGRPRLGRDARRRIRRQNMAGRRRTDWTGPGPDAHDPQRLGALLSDYVDDRGWDRPLAEARVFAEWPALVGADVAAHCTPTGLQDGQLRIAAESTAWATQLRLLAGTMLARLVAELGPEVVTKLVITGPAAPSWKHGAFSVRGARGPRDTYG